MVGRPPPASSIGFIDGFAARGKPCTSIRSRGRWSRNPTVVSLHELAMALGVTHMDLVRPAGRKKPE
jgi:hypothetical protein